MTPPVRSANALGRDAEEQACQHLESHGMATLARNFRCRQGEIDLVMSEGATIVFVEVRMRTHQRYGGAAESVDRRKQARIIAAAEYYLLQTPGAAKRPCRFDVIATTGHGNALHWIKNAFDLS